VAGRIAAALAAGPGRAPVAGVASLLALAEAALPDHPVVPGGLSSLLVLVQALGDAGIAAPLWALTRGAIATGLGEAVTAPVQAQTWGVGRVVALEHPDRWGGLVDLPAAWDERAAARLCAVLAGNAEDGIAVRPDGLMGRRLVRAAQSRQPRAWTPGGTVLVTGGTGALAGHVSRWLTRRGAARIVLTSRSGAGAPGMAALAAGLAEAGSAVDLLACDLAERSDVAGLLDRIAATGPALSSVVHTAGVLDDGVLDQQGPDRLATTLGAKAGGATWLDELTRGTDLDAFVMFSSAASTFGSGGQGKYAAANAYLDALVEQRRAQGLPGLAVAWGPWAGPGVSQHTEAARARLKRNNWEVLMDPELAVRALGRAVDDPDDVVLTIMDLDWPLIASAPAAAGLRSHPMVRDLPDLRHAARRPETVADGAQDDGRGGELARRVSGLARAEQDRVLTDLVRGEAASILNHPSAESVEPDRAFSEMGFDSLTSVELRNRLAAATGLRLPTTLLFDYPSPTVLADYLRTELLGVFAAAPAAVPGIPGVAGVSGAEAGEPIAIVGMGCRFPGGVRSPEDLWAMVAGGVDGVSPLPSDRGWDIEKLYDPDPDHAGTSYVREGGYVQQVAEFDPAFFGISPREALAMDPQQRLLLETSWEALERAGIDPASLRGSRTGVFVGGYGSGYEALGIELARSGAEGGEQVEGHLITGNATSVLSGRLSYTLGLEGPAFTVDTACSSSLVAMHLACQALAAGECSLALVCGVTIMPTPRDLIGFSRQRGLAADGRSKAFSAAADGMGIAEGAGTLVVERLSDAVRHGHQVLAVVRGSAVNQDGASNGLTAPNGPSQQRVIRAALANARLTASEVDAVEAHGTGTPLGDPIEVQALMATYGQERAEDRPLWLGSVKSNIGHTQAAAGVAGLVKMVMALRNGMLPRTLHAAERSPHIDWAAGHVRLLTEAVPWEQNGHPRRAAVSGFGISGTNAHVIVEEAPAGEPEIADEPAAVPVTPVLTGSDVAAWLVSARSSESLAAQADRVRDYAAARPDVAGCDLAWSLATTRSVFEHRAVVVGAGRDELTEGFAALAARQGGVGIVSGVVRGPARIGFVFSGQGSQRSGMGRDLYAASPAFAQAFDEVCALLEAELKLPVAEVVLGRAEDVDADATVFAQAGLFAVQVGLAAVLKAAGITPDAVAGHSVGEIAAAYVAGVLSLPDACRLLAARAAAMQALPVGGSMCAIAVSEDEVAETLIPGVSLAAVNGPTSVVVSGDADAVEQVASIWRDRGARTRMLRVSHAFHSHRMDPMLDELAETAGRLGHQTPRIAWACGLTGEVLTDVEPGYWAAQARGAVRFADAVSALAGRGVRVVVELGPDGTLSAMGPAALGDDSPVVFTPLLRADTDPARSLLSALGTVHVQGGRVDWAAVLEPGETVDLPTYAFQRQRYWPDMPARTVTQAQAADSEFWSAVENGDLDRLADTLAVPGDQLSGVLPALASWRRRELEDSAVSAWRYRVRWEAIADATSAAPSGTWLVVAPAGRDLAVDCARALTDRGAAVVRFEVGLEDHNRITLGQRLRDLALDDCAGVLWAADSAAVALGQTGASGHAVASGNASADPTDPGLLVLVQALGDANLTAPVWAVTRGAVSTGPGDPLTAPADAAVWGLGRVVGLEHPERWGGLVDLPPAWSERTAARLAAVLAGAAGDDDQVAIRPAGLLARRLVHAARSRAGGRAPYTPRGTALITGGTGAIGGHSARWLAGRGVERLVLTSRSGAAAEGAAALAAELAAAGAGVDIVACDVADRPSVGGLLDRIAAEGPQLTAVLHTAGLGQASYIEETNVAQHAAVTGAKADGARWLDELTAHLDLDAFVLFSSIAAVWGSAIQPGYAAANTYLDALAENRRARGLAATSVSWGPWGGGGMTNEEDADRMRLRGLRMLAPAAAIQALAQAVDAGEDLLTVADVEWDRFAPLFTLRRPSPLIEALPEVRRVLEETAAASEQGSAEAGGELAARLAGLAAAEQERILVDLVRAEAATALGHRSAEAVEADRAFSDLGFDSLTGVDLRNRLTAATGTALSATMVFDYPTPVALAGYLRQAIAPPEADGPAALPVLAELDRVESLLTADVPEDDHERITARLEAVVARWKEVRARAGGVDVVEVLDRLEASTDDEVFDFLGKEFGIH
jgi:acyl transferase domain-containing protein